MGLTAGDKLGPYEILSPIGAGGMGEVYRARDTKLKRDVALKVLPETFARDPERLARLQREAEVLASLNNPNIAAIYGLEDNALVMELVEGASPKGPMPFDEACHIASQIASALEYAHEKGIVHRDLKPANIKITPDGVVKLLDFGLAKAFTNQREAPPPNSENSPTLTIAATEIGMILGTAAYMAPEQAKGKSVDRRADIWAFGVVLFELLTGERLFQGEDVSETLAQVLTKRPDFDQAPVKFRRVLQACLQKDPKQRLQAIGDWRLLLEDAQESEPARSRSRFGTAPWMAAGAFAIAALILGLLYLRQPVQDSRVLKMSVLPPDKVVLPPNAIPAISPDGRQLAFEAALDGKTSLWVRDLDSLDARPLPGTEGATLPFWSPDSRFLGFFANGKLKKTSVTGGPVLTLCEAAVGRGGTWNQNDVIVFAPAILSALYSVPAAGGTPVPVTTITEQEPAHRFPWFLPDGRRFLFTAYGPNREKDTLFVGDLESKGRRELMPATSNVVYASGYLLFLRELTLIAQRFDPSKLQTSGDAIPVAERVGYNSLDIRGMFTLSANGILAYTSPSRSGYSQLVWFDRSGKTTGVLGAPGGDDFPAVSPDGKTVAIMRPDPQTGLADIWLYDLIRGTNFRFTFNSQNNRWPVWSPDGSHLAFYSSPGGLGATYQRASSGTGQDEILEKIGYPSDWSSDGRYIIEAHNDARTGYDIWILPLFGDRKPFPFLQTNASERWGKLSPNRRWLAYASDESRRTEVYVQTFPTPGGKWQISTSGGDHPVWRRDGNELFYIGPDGKMMAAEVKSGASFQAGLPKPLFNTRLAGTAFDVSKDGRFLIPTQIEQTSSAPITVVINWTAGLKK